MLHWFLRRHNGHQRRYAVIPTFCLAWFLAVPGAASELEKANQAWTIGELNSAVIRLKSLLQTNPEDPEARLLLGRIYLDNADSAAAEHALERARAAGAADVDVRPPLVEALVAQRKFARAIELTEIDGDMPPTLIAELLGLRGFALLMSGDSLAARTAFEQAKEADPKAVRPLLGLADMALQNGDTDQTRELIDQVLEIAPQQPDGWRALGSLEYQTGNYDAAVAAYGKALEYARSKWFLHYQRGLAKLETKAPEEAWNDAESLTEHHARVLWPALPPRPALLDPRPA